VLPSSALFTVDPLPLHCCIARDKHSSLFWGRRRKDFRALAIWLVSITWTAFKHQWQSKFIAREREQNFMSKFSVDTSIPNSAAVVEALS
jgi:hypothetical protein